jgi:hypothetical protein
MDAQPVGRRKLLVKHAGAHRPAAWIKARCARERIGPEAWTSRRRP